MSDEKDFSSQGITDEPVIGENPSPETAAGEPGIGEGPSPSVTVGEPDVSEEPSPVDGAAGSRADAQPPEEESREELIEQLDELIEKMRQAQPEYTPPPFSFQRLIQLIQDSLGRIAPEWSLALLERLRASLASDMFNIDTWKGIWFVLNYTLEYQQDFLKRRFTGDYETDEWGYDPEIVSLLRPFFEFLYRRYWRVEVSGIENVPETGAALLVANHSGQLPWDGSMVGVAMLTEHPSSRLVRTLVADWFQTLPFISTVLVKAGQTLANEENGIRLLEQGELVAVYPEGIKGVGKLYKERYQLSRFGRGGFVRMALKTGAPMIPVAIVGAEETYISLTKSEPIAKSIGFPFFPISVTWPWCGLLGFVPFPTKWTIDFGEPVQTDPYGPGAADNLVLVSQLADQMRNTIQKMVYDRLAQRKSVLFG